MKLSCIPSSVLGSHTPDTTLIARDCGLFGLLLSSAEFRPILTALAALAIHSKQTLIDHSDKQVILYYCLTTGN